MKNFVFTVIFLLALIAPTACIVKSIRFDQQCAGYIKQAADANTVELALQRLQVAIDYAESHNLTSGYTSVLWKTEDENIGFWYQNLLMCQQELMGAQGGTQLEKSNILMKVRESLTDQGEKGTELKIPDGISRYPNNLFWGIFRLISYIILCAFLIRFYIWVNEL